MNTQAWNEIGDAIQKNFPREHLNGWEFSEVVQDGNKILAKFTKATEESLVHIGWETSTGCSAFNGGKVAEKIKEATKA